MQDLFGQISQNYADKKPVVSLCNKCLKKLSLKSAADVCNLRDLALWMFIYYDVKTALQLIEMTHGLKFEHNYPLWEHIFSMWGLEIYIHRKSENIAAAEKRKELLIECLDTPKPNQSKQERLSQETARRQRMTFLEWGIRSVDKFILAFDDSFMRYYMLEAIANMMQYGECGLWPDFVANNALREAKIVEYADILANRVASPIAQKYEDMKKTFSQILAKNKDIKPVANICKKFSKNINLLNNKDLPIICDLCYWLFAYNDSDSVFDVANHFIFLDLPCDTIYQIKLLQAYIYRKKDMIAASDDLIRQSVDAENYSRNHVDKSFDELSLKSQIELASPAEKQGLLLKGMQNLIRYGENKLYPDFVANDDMREKLIADYAKQLAYIYSAI